MDHHADRRVCRPTADKLDTRPDVLVARRAAEAWGVLSLAELHACGLSRDAVTTRVRHGHLHRVHRGVFAVGHAALPVEGRFLAAVKACGPDAVLGHMSAAALWGIVAWDDRHPEVTVCGAGTRTRAGLRVHRTTGWRAGEITEHKGIPVTTPARTLLDLAVIFRPRALRRAVRQAQSLKLTSVREIADLIARSRGRPGVARLAATVATGPAPTRSELEDVVLELILRGGLEHPQVNVPLVLDGRRVVPDFRWPSARLVVEADGAAWHDNELARADDAERQALLERHGERVVRLTWQQAVAQPAQTLARLRAAGAPAAWFPATMQSAAAA